MPKIDRDIPIPDDAGRRMMRYPQLLDMLPGDSIAVPVEERRNLYDAAKYHQRKNGKKFMGRTLANGQEFRLWRLE